MKNVQLFLILLFIISCSTAPEINMTDPIPVNTELKITTEEAVNREFAFTDKKSGYFYGFTHGPGTDWFSGWNVNTKRIISDYELFAGDTALDRSDADVTVRPNMLMRNYLQATEELYLYDGIEVIEIRLNTDLDEIGIRLIGDDMISSPGLRFNYALYTITEFPDKVLVLASIRDAELTLIDHRIEVQSGAEGFMIFLADDEESGVAFAAQFREDRLDLLESRKSRIEELLQTNLHNTGISEVDQALAWNLISLDALIMKQTGWGIYAGLPWFNDYWGRDIFISLPGATLVNGQIDVAGNILRSFAEYQNTDENDPDYGRIPNRLRPDEVIYNTTDGTPRFVAQICDYLDYGGDKSIAADLYEAVARATDGPVDRHMDEDGYLTHGDAETWMDAREEPDKRAYSPRGNRANDIQALWYRQLRCAARLARMNSDDEKAEEWEGIAEKMKVQFLNDFFDSDHTYMADRITLRGVPSYSMRPNQLFALDLVDDTNIRNSVIREAWERLVYPWGTASLDQDDINFHPWHEASEHYHKDSAYHNGTVWIWNNGIAMQRMIEAGQPDIAWNLFLNMSHQTLHQGGVGMLAENTDALPRPGESEVRLSGTFSQAWSSAEYIRVWYRHFLGIQPGQMGESLLLRPQIPSSIDELAVSVPVFRGKLNFNFSRDESARTYKWRYTGRRNSMQVLVDLPGFRTVELNLQNLHTVRIRTAGDKMELQLLDSNHMIIREQTVRKDPVKIARRDASDKYFEGTNFAVPNLRDDLRSLGGSRMENDD